LLSGWAGEAVGWAGEAVVWLARIVGIVAEGVTTRILFCRMVGQMAWARSTAVFPAQPDNGTMRTLPPLATAVSAVSPSPIFSNQARTCSTRALGPRTMSRRVVGSASTFSEEPSPPKSLVIESTATCGSSERSGITSTQTASLRICSSVA
jgi:hypothetical protein